MRVRAISLALGLALAAPVAADDGGPRAVAPVPDGDADRTGGDAAADGRVTPARRGDGDRPRKGGDGTRADVKTSPPSKDEEILLDLEMLMLFEMLQDYDFFAEDEK